ncbi:MAG: SBBP repeat-containing protein [Candidatus Jettenia sp. CY-1]|nr:MAG: SBBP repeat-containing protein [Candidatus Jettenia sp. CY-1]
MERSMRFFGSSVVLLFTLVLTGGHVFGEGNARRLTQEEFAQKAKRLQLPFIANEGQADKRVGFYANTFSGTVFVTKEGEIIYSLPHSGNKEDEDMKGPGGLPPNDLYRIRYIRRYAQCRLPHYQGTVHPASPVLAFIDTMLQNTSCKKGLIVKEELVNGKIVEIKGEDESETKVSYFKGNDPSKWRSGIATYGEVNLGEVYEGIELRLKAYGDNVEKLFCVKPGADPGQIQVRLSGVKLPNPPNPPLEKGGFDVLSLQKEDKGNFLPFLKRDQGGLYINEKGQLEVETELGKVTFTKPVAFQEIEGKRVDVAVEYRVQKTEARSQNKQEKTSQLTTPDSSTSQLVYGFTVASYDTSKELIIDPLLASTFLGGSGNDYGYSLAIDTGGNVYVTGHTTDATTDLPTTAGAYDTSHNGSSDAFVSKFNSGLTSLLASTFLGGSSSDYGISLAIDTEGNIYVTGDTDDAATDLPTTPGAYDTSHNGSSDAFVSKFNSGLTSLLASTFLGGSSSDYGISLAIDTTGNVYVAGYTNDAATDLPTTPGAYDTSHNGSYDVFVSKFNSGLTSLLASTFLGGSSSDQGFSLAIDTEGNVYMTGHTYDAATDLPTTSSAYDTSHNGSWDVFVSKFNSGLTSLLASTFLGGSSGEWGYSLAIDTEGNVYVAGYTNDAATDLPTTPGAYDTSHNGSYDVFVSKFDSGLTNLLASTLLGGSSYDYGKFLAIDMEENIYVTGYTTDATTDLPTTAGAYDTSHNGWYDVFVSKFDSGLTNLLASTLLGDSGNEWGTSLAIDTEGNVYVTGYTADAATDLPTTAGAYDTSHNGGDDVFVSRFDSNLSEGTWYIASMGGNNAEGTFTSLALDRSEWARISYYNASNGNLQIVYNIYNGSWPKSTPDKTGNVGMYSSLAIKKSTFQKYISYYDRTNGDLKFATAEGKTIPWSVSTIDSTGNVGLYTSLAFDSTDKVYISYYDATNQDLKCASTSTPLDPASWTITTVDSAGDVGMYTSLAIDSMDNVHISYYDHTNGDLKHALYTNGSWSTEIVHGGNAWVGKYSSLAVDSSDAVHISYYNASSTGLNYAHKVNGSWVSESIDTVGLVGSYTSLAIDASDNVHISYHDYTNGDLKYTHNTTGSWTTITVDSAGRVGAYTSIKVDSNGFVHISYYDRSNTDLKYARSLIPYGASDLALKQPYPGNIRPSRKRPQQKNRNNSF